MSKLQKALLASCLVFSVSSLTTLATTADQVAQLGKLVGRQNWGNLLVTILDTIIDANGALDGEQLGDNTVDEDAIDFGSGTDQVDYTDITTGNISTATAFTIDVSGSGLDLTLSTDAGAGEDLIFTGNNLDVGADGSVDINTVEWIDSSGNLDVPGTFTASSTSLLENNVTLDDNTTDSPTVTWTDAGESTGTIHYNDSADTFDILCPGSGEISFGNDNLTTTGTLDAAATTITTLAASGNATFDDDTGDSPTVTWTDAGESTGTIHYNDTNDTFDILAPDSGEVSFGDDNVTTTGTLDAAATVITTLSATTGAFSNNVTLDDNTTDSPTVTWTDAGESSGSIHYDDTGDHLEILASSGEIEFGDENLTTTGTLDAGAVTLTSITDAATTLAATMLELTAVGDLSARMVASSGSEAFTVAAHEGRNITLTGSGSAFTRTLPAATGTGAIYRVSIGVANTSNHIIAVAASPGTDIMHGVIMSGDTDDGTTDYIWQTASDSDTITLDGTAQGGIVGDWIEFRDTVSGTWEVFGYTNSSGGSEATPFSAAVS